MRILIVAMSESIHTARWISQINDRGWDIHLFPSTENQAVHHNLTGVTVHCTFYPKLKKESANIKIIGIPVLFDILSRVLNRMVISSFPNFKAWRLSKLIKNIQPDIVHSLEMQAGGYLSLEAKNRLGDFPKWIVTVFAFAFLFAHQGFQTVRPSIALWDCSLGL